MLLGSQQASSDPFHLLEVGQAANRALLLLCGEREEDAEEDGNRRRRKDGDEYSDLRLSFRSFVITGEGMNLRGRKVLDVDKGDVGRERVRNGALTEVDPDCN